MPGAQRELRTFISHSHVCTFSINNVELKYIQSSLADSQAISPFWHPVSGEAACRQMCILNLAFPHPSGFLGMAASGPQPLFSHA